MDVIPHVGAGGLRFGMDEAAVRALLGAPTQRVAYDEQRTGLAFGEEVDVVMHAERGLVSITRGRGPAMLFGAELFALDRDGIEALLAPHAAIVWEPLDRFVRTLSAPALGLIVYFEGDDPAPTAVELTFGTWHRGLPDE
jgi:hypothetical protein